MAVGIRLLIAVTAAVAAVFTLLVSVTGSIHFAYSNRALDAAVEGISSVIALVVAQLLYGRFRQTQQRRDLLLTASLSVFAVTNLCLSTIPIVAEAEPGSFATWGAASGRLLSVALLALAAVVPDRQLHTPKRSAEHLLGGCAVVLGVVALAVLVAGDELPRAIAPHISPDAAQRPRIVGNALILAFQLTEMTLYTVAALGFARQAERTQDELTRWIAIAATLGAFARLNYFLFPSLYSPYFYTGDVLRLALFVALAIGSALELRRTRDLVARAAVQEERERIARDIHDGVAQDLAFILQHGRRLADRDDAPSGLRNVVLAAERALDECRHAITALVRVGDEPLHEALTLTALETAGREGAMVEMKLDQSITVPATTQQAMLRVLREAIINAIRHGGAQNITVELSQDPDLRLVVVDDGSGFDRDAVAQSRGRLGLRSMEARIAAVGGELVVESRPGTGTRVEALLR